jgi:hypothetical protein
MNDNKMTVKLWAQIVEVDADRAENLNGGSGHGCRSVYVGVSGGMGPLQINGVDGTQLKIQPKGKGLRYYSYYRPGYHHSH